MRRYWSGSWLFGIGVAGCQAAGPVLAPLNSIGGTGLQSGFLFDRGPFAACHASTIVEVDAGRLLAAYFAGSGEGDPDVGIWTSQGTADPDGAVNWSGPRQVARHAGVPCWNPVLHKKRGAELLLFYKAGPSPRTWSGHLTRSHDGGQTWSAPELLPAGILGPIKNKPLELPNPNSAIDAVRLADGRIVLVYNHSRDHRTPLNVAVSEDGGEHFRPAFELETAPGEYSYPAVIQTRDARVHTTYTWNRKRIKHVSFELTGPKGPREQT